MSLIGILDDPVRIVILRKSRDTPISNLDEIDAELMYGLTRSHCLLYMPIQPFKAGLK